MASLLLGLQGWGHRIDCGDVDAEFTSGAVEHVLEGEARVGGQEHFYLEPNCAIVIPKEMDEIDSFASTQARPQTQSSGREPQIQMKLGLAELPMHIILWIMCGA